MPRNFLKESQVPTTAKFQKIPTSPLKDRKANGESSVRIAAELVSRQNLLHPANYAARRHFRVPTLSAISDCETVDASGRRRADGYKWNRCRASKLIRSGGAAVEQNYCKFPMRDSHAVLATVDKSFAITPRHKAE